MAVTLTGDGEITYASFPITKTETTEDGDLIVYGKATDGSVDSDQQIVKPEFAFKAIKHWKDTGANVRVQHNPQRDPAGKGIGVEFDGDATWVKSLIVEDAAKKLVAKGVLTAYSVGIARPKIERDVSGKARGGIITDGMIVEISLVDRPANKSCGIQLVKSADGDTVELTSDIFGDKDVLAKMLGTEDVLNKGDMDFSPDTVPDFKFTPNDLAKIVRDKIIEDHYSDLAIKAIIEAESAVYKRNVNTAERRSLASQGHALPDGSYPIANTGDLGNAAHLAATGHGNADAAKKLIARRAKELGVANPLSEDTEGKAEEAVTDVVVPDAVKDQNGESGPKVSPVGNIPAKKPGEPEESPCPPSAEDSCKEEKAAKPKKKGKAKLPPWLNKPDAGDADDCKVDHAHTEKCHTTPAEAAGVAGNHDMSPAPVGELMESPKPDHMKDVTGNPEMAAFVRFKTVGIDPELGTLHDFTCPAFHPAEVSKYYPYADFSTLISEEVWQRKALAAATGGSMEKALDAQGAWQSAVILKSADPGVINDFRLAQYKAFRDANPGPTSFPTPGSVSAQRFCRPNLGGGSGHSKDSSGYGSPNSAPQVATSAPNAHSFDRPPLGSGHQSPSPSHMKYAPEYPTEQGVPVRITYAELEKEKARRAVSMLHDHIIHQFPSICPINDKDAYAVEQPTAVPPVTGLGKSIEAPPVAEVLGDVYKYIRKLEKKVRAGEISEEEARTRLSKRTAEKYAHGLNQQVQKGLTSRSEILKALGIEQPQAAPAAPVPAPVPETFGARPGDDVIKGLSPDVMKTMMSEILAPFQEKISAQETELAEYRRRETERDAQFNALLEKQTQNDQRWEDLANKADPGTQGWAGLAINPLRQPAAVAKTAEIHKQRADEMVMRQLERAARTSENPAEREAAWSALYKMQGS